LIICKLNKNIYFFWIIYFFEYILPFSPSIDGSPSATSGERNWCVPANVVTFNLSGEYLSNSYIIKFIIEYLTLKFLDKFYFELKLF